MQDFSEREIGCRLASLADGEGCFFIGKLVNKQGNPYYSCSFQVKMRADDEPFLERMADLTGIGALTEYISQRQDGHDRKPQVAWIVRTKADCLTLCMIFDRYPLWSKKARDYAIWRRAVIEWNDHEPGDDWLPMEEFRESLMAGRAYAA